MPPASACELALAAARAIEADLVGVDLLPTPDGGYVVLELNGAVEFTQEYALEPGDVFGRAVDALRDGDRGHGPRRLRGVLRFFPARSPLFLPACRRLRQR